MATRWNRYGAALIALALLGAGCSGSSEPAGPAQGAAGVETAAATQPIFGTEDTVCQSVRLRNDDDDQAKATSATDCLLAEVEAGRAVTVDIAGITADGDPIYMRYAFDGETTLIVEDDRGDTYGIGSVLARRCDGVQPSSWFPEGIDCEPVDHPGFPEAPAEPQAIN